MAIVPLPHPKDKEGVKAHERHLKIMARLSGILGISLGILILLIMYSIVN